MTSKTILYVEDHPPARLLMSAIISDLTAHTMVSAGTGAEACEIAARIKPDLYMLDLDLLDGDGRAVAESLLKLHPAPLIFVSAYAEAIRTGDLSQFASVSHTYLAKPLDPENVVQVIERTLA